MAAPAAQGGRAAAGPGGGHARLARPPRRPGGGARALPGGRAPRRGRRHAPTPAFRAVLARGREPRRRDASRPRRRSRSTLAGGACASACSRRRRARPARRPRTRTRAPWSRLVSAGGFDLLLSADAESDALAAARPARRRRDEGAPPRQRGPGSAGAARAAAIPSSPRSRWARTPTATRRPRRWRALAAPACATYRTDRHGTVTLTLDGGERCGRPPSAERRPAPRLDCRRGRPEARLPRQRRRRRQDRRLARPRAQARRGGARPGRARDLRRAPRSEPAEVAAALAALTFDPGTRYLLVDDAGAWKAAQLGPLEATLADMPPDTVLVLIVRGKPLKQLLRRRREGRRRGARVRGAQALGAAQVGGRARPRARPPARQGGREGAGRAGRPEPAAPVTRAREARARRSTRART